MAAREEALSGAKVKGGPGSHRPRETEPPDTSELGERVSSHVWRASIPTAHLSGSGMPS